MGTAITSQKPIRRRTLIAGCIAMLALAMALLCSCSQGSSASAAASSDDSDEYIMHADRYVSKAEGAHIIDFDAMLQADELPSGCEIVSAAMLLDHYGYTCDKMELYGLIDCAEDFSRGDDGTIYGPDPDYTFIGDPTTDYGYTCNIAPLAKAVDTYISTQGDASHVAKDITGATWDDLYAYIDDDMPVEILVCGSEDDPSTFETWVSDEVPGKEVIGYPLVHAVVLIGYDGDDAIIADPIAGIYPTDAAELEFEYEQRGSYAMVIAPSDNA